MRGHEGRDTVPITCCFLLLLTHGVTAADDAEFALGTALGDCTAASAKGWSWDRNSTQQISRGGQCLEVTSVAASSQPMLRPCKASTTLQKWVVAGGSVAVASAPHFQWVSSSGDTKPDGAEVWLYDITNRQGYCKTHRSCSFAFDDAAGSFKNPAGSCVVAASTGPAPPPPPPPPPHPQPHKPTKTLVYTCAPGSVESGLPFCETSLGFEARSEDLVSRLNISEQIGMFFSYPGTPYISRFNIKSMNLDSTCIHGLASRRAGKVTVFPHAIAQGASWDPELVFRMSNITAIEARISSAISYARNGGTDQGTDLSCDGGPLANSAHDPRWGRIAETYGEDPTLIQTMGVSAIRGLQSPQPVPGGKAEDVFFATRQVTRHYIGYHGASPDIEAARGTGSCNFIASARSLNDSYFPTYGAFQDPSRGRADGIMCAMSKLNGESSCGNKLLLQTMLRDQWHSDAIVQSDCCDSVQTMVHGPSPRTGLPIQNYTEAFGTAVNAGLGTYYGYWVNNFRSSMADLLGLNGPAALRYGNGEVLRNATLRAAAKRMIVTLMRLGFYDSHRSDYPFKYLQENTSWALLDSAGHRAVAREVAAKSIVLLKNRAVLPLGKLSSIAVIGPFAACSGPQKGYGPLPNNTDPRYLTASQGSCYLHSYNGQPSNITSIYGGIAEAGEAVGVKVEFSIGSNSTCLSAAADLGEVDCWSSNSSNPNKFYSAAAAAAIAKAKHVAATNDVTVLALGLGVEMEGEGRDRVNMTLPALQRALYEAVASVAKKLVVVIVSAGGVDFDESNAAAVLYAPYGGEEAGSGLADVLFGKVNPSGRLPTTWVTQAWSDAMNCNNYTEVAGQARKYKDDCNTSILHLDLEAGVGRTHRYIHKSAKFIKHRFGFGLSYASFHYSALSIVREVERSDVSGNPGLTAQVTIKNTATVAGAEIVQVYATGVTVPGLVTPLQNLLGFTKIELGAGVSQTVHVSLDASQLETAKADGTRAIVPGVYTVWAGGHQPDDMEGAAGSSGEAVNTTLTM